MNTEWYLAISPMNIEMAPQDGQETELDTTSAESFSCVSLIRSCGLSISSDIPSRIGHFTVLKEKCIFWLLLEQTDLRGHFGLGISLNFH